MVHKVLIFVLFRPLFSEKSYWHQIKKFASNQLLTIFNIWCCLFLFFGKWWAKLFAGNFIPVFCLFVCLFIIGFFKDFIWLPIFFLNRFVFLLAWSYLSSHIWQLMAQITKLHRKKRTSCFTPFLKPQTKQPTEQPSAGCKHTNWLLEGLSLHMLKPNLNHSVRS